MKSAADKTVKSRWDIFKAPTLVLKVESIYWVWILCYGLAFLGLFVDYLNGKMSNSINNGMIYNSCIAVICPLLLDIFVDVHYGNRRETKEEFSSYKTWVMCVCLVAIVLIALLYGTDKRSSVSLQVICFIVVLILSFYSYLVTKMSNHSILMGDYKDRPYCDAESELLLETKKKSKRLKKTTTSDGTEVKL